MRKKQTQIVSDAIDRNITVGDRRTTIVGYSNKINSRFILFEKKKKFKATLYLAHQAAGPREF